MADGLNCSYVNLLVHLLLISATPLCMHIYLIYTTIKYLVHVYIHTCFMYIHVPRVHSTVVCCIVSSALDRYITRVLYLAILQEQGEVRTVYTLRLA